MSEATQDSHPVKKARTTREMICNWGIVLGSVGLVLTLSAAVLHLLTCSRVSQAAGAKKSKLSGETFRLHDLANWRAGNVDGRHGGRP